MDTEAPKVDVNAQIAEIRAHMPAVYQAIQDKAEQIGKEAFAIVRKGLRGEPNCFYAFERGRVVGTPFSHGELTKDVAAMMVQFGVAFVCIWREPGSDAAKGANDGKA